MRHHPTPACVILPADPASLLIFAHEADQRPLEPTPAKLIGKPIVCSCLTHDEGVPATTTGLAMARAALGAGGAAMFLHPD